MDRFRKLSQLPRILFAPRQITLSRYDLVNFAILIVVSFLIEVYKVMKSS